jgi:hypothetical protein
MSAELSDILAEAKAEVTGPPKWPSGAARGIQKVSYTHDAMIDLIIANPAVSQNALAAHFGYSASWVSQVIASDAFQARLAERTKDLVDPTIRATVEDRFKALVLRSLDILREKLDNPSHTVPDNLALRTLELSSRALGYGARHDPTPPAPVNVSVHLENLGGNLVQLLRKKKLEASEAEEITIVGGPDGLSQQP